MGVKFWVGESRLNLWSAKSDSPLSVKPHLTASAARIPHRGGRHRSHAHTYTCDRQRERERENLTYMYMHRKRANMNKERKRDRER
jgi:hypothetical protein